MSEPITVVRHIGIKYANGDSSIIPYTLPIDPGNHFTVSWPALIHYRDKSFKFCYSGPTGRNIFSEVVECEEEELSLEESNEALELLCDHQNQTILSLERNNIDYLHIINQLQNRIKLIEQKLNANK